MVYLYVFLLLTFLVLYKYRRFWKRTSFANKTVWITGASSGIGEHLSYEFAKYGAFIILSGRNQSELSRVHSKIPNSKIFPLDLSDSNSAFITATEFLKTNSVDILINNAGVSQRAIFEECLTNLENERKLMEVNYFSVVALTKAFVKALNGREGKIVVVTSGAGLLPAPSRTGYSAAKAAIIGYYDALRAELKDMKVEVVNLAPGFVNTNVSVNALGKDGKPFGVKDPFNLQGLQPEDFSRSAVRKIFLGESHILLATFLTIVAYYIKAFSFDLCNLMIKHKYTKSIKQVIKKTS